MNSLPVGGMTMRTACGHDHLAQDLAARHSERAPGELLPRIDRQQPGADDLRTCTRPRSATARSSAARNGVNHAAGEDRPQLRQRVPDEEQLEQRRRRAEDPVVEEDEAARPHAEPAEPAEREEEADRRPRPRATRTVSARASSAPFQYGPEESAAQNRCVSKLASTSLAGPTSRRPTGTLYFAASFASVPFAFSALDRRPRSARRAASPLR